VGRFARLVFQDSDSPFGSLFGRKDGQQQGNCKKSASEVDCGFSQYGCGLGAENVFRHPGPERSSESLASGSLHQDDQGQQNTDDHQNREEYRDKNRQPHKGRNMSCPGAGVKLRLVRRPPEREALAFGVRRSAFGGAVRK
jgi:hypothetical protein